MQFFNWFILLIGFLLSGCMLGPNFHRPAPPFAQAYSERPLPIHTAKTPSAGKAGISQQFVIGEDIPRDWWYLFHSAELNALIERGLNNNRSYEAAYATLQQAAENYKAQIGNLLFPAFNANLGVQRGNASGASSSSSLTGSSSVFSIYNANVSVSYTLDFFGAARRQVEAARAQVDFEGFQLIATYLTLTSNIVTTAITIASLEDQIKETELLIRDERNQLNILQKQFQLGGISLETVLTQQTLVNQTEATLPLLQKQLSQNRHALSVLVGAYTNEPLPTLHLDSLVLPRHIPISIPANLVRQRPDVRAAEATWHVASAQVGVATANLFPNISISGSYGWQGTSPGALFNPNSLVWNIAGQATQPLFHGGALWSTREAAIANYKQACYQYQQTVLQAFQNVADSLRAIETDARTFRSRRAAELAARKNFYLTTQQFKLGGVSYLNLLVAEQQYQQAVLNRIQSQADRYTDTAALFQSLGGGWWHRCWSINKCVV